MKKNIQMPEVRVINFRSNDVIATSGPAHVSYAGSNAQDGPTTAETQSRSSIWE